MYFQGRKVTLEGRNATQRWRGDAGGGPRVGRGRSSLCRAATGQSSASASAQQMFTSSLTATSGTSTTRRDKQTNKQTKKRRCTIARVTRLTHTRTRLLQKIRARYPTDIPSFPAGGPEPLLLRFHFPIALRVVVVVVIFFFFLASQTLAGTWKNCPHQPPPRESQISFQPS